MGDMELYDDSVAIAPDSLLEQALTLSSADRAKLAARLLSSLDDEHTDNDLVERLWAEECQRRTAQLESGTSRPSTESNSTNA